MAGGITIQRPVEKDRGRETGEATASPNVRGSLNRNFRDFGIKKGGNYFHLNLQYTRSEAHGEVSMNLQRFQ